MVIDEHYIHDGRESIVYFYNAPHELRNTRGFDLNCRSIEVRFFEYILFKFGNFRCKALETNIS